MYEKCLEQRCEIIKLRVYDTQYNFRIFITQQHFKKSWEILQSLSLFCRPWENIQQVSSWKALGSVAGVGVDGRLLLDIKSLYSCSEVCVRVSRVKSQPFIVDVLFGLQQSCVLSPFLSIVLDNWIDSNSWTVSELGAAGSTICFVGTISCC